MKKSIWFQKVDLDAINRINQGMLAGLLKITFTHADDHHLVAMMPVEPRLHQPLGSLHGGASCVLAETAGSIAANLCVDPKEKACVGLEISANHIRPVSEGLLTAKASPLHLGKTTHVWDIKIYNELEKLICVSRLTVAVIEKKQPSV